MPVYLNPTYRLVNVIQGGVSATSLTSTAADSYSNIYTSGTYGATAANIFSPSGVNTTLNLPITSGQSAALLVKYNPRGTPLFRTYIDTVGVDQGLSVTTDANANSYLVGTTSGGSASVYYSNTSNTANIITSSNVQFGVTSQPLGFVMRSYDNGVPAWKTYVSNLTATPTNMASVAVDTASNVYACGTYGPNGNSNIFYSNSLNVSNVILATAGFPSNSAAGGYMMRLDNTGNVISTGYLLVPTGGSCTSNSIAVDSVSNIYVAGTYLANVVVFSNNNTLSAVTANNGGPSVTGTYVVKYFGNGNAVWSGTIYGNPSTNTNPAVVADAGGNVVVTGTYIQTTNIYANNVISTLALPIPAAGSAGFAVRYTSAGAPNLRMAVDGLGNETITGVVTDPVTSNIFVCGSYGPQAANIYNNTAASSLFLPATSGGLVGGFVTRFDAVGAPQWQVSISGSSAVNVLSVNTDSTLSSYITGTYGPGAVTVFDTIGSATGLPVQTTTAGFSIKLDSNGRIVFANST
jgi:Beta-propeller repeat